MASAGRSGFNRRNDSRRRSPSATSEKRAALRRRLAGGNFSATQGSVAKCLQDIMLPPRSLPRKVVSPSLAALLFYPKGPCFPGARTVLFSWIGETRLAWGLGGFTGAPRFFWETANSLVLRFIPQYQT